uniref:Uncharacterized protein n=1 Tax=viral metagenome TaxID=1070528 RepID=A0A6C0KCY5_9ZZZZ
MADQLPKEKAKRVLKLKKTPALEAVPVAAPAPEPQPTVTVEQPKPKRVLKLKKTAALDSIVPIAEAFPQSASAQAAKSLEAVCAIGSASAIASIAPAAKRTLKLKTNLLKLPVFPGENVERYTSSWEAIDLVREWFADRNEPVPQAEIKFAIEMLEADRQLGVKEAEEAAKPKKPVLGPMPEYGSQDFWKWCRMRKAIKEAELKEKGLPIPEPKPKKPRKKKEPKA